MSAAVKRKAPPTVGAVKSAGGRPGRRLHKKHHPHSTTKKKIRQIIRFAVWLTLEYVRPLLGFFLILMMFGFIGGTERDKVEMAAGMKLAFKCLIAGALLLVPEMTFFDKGGRR